MRCPLLTTYVTYVEVKMLMLKVNKVEERIMRQLTDRKNKCHFRATTPAARTPAPPPAAMPHPGARRSTAQRSRRMGEGRAIRGAGVQARERRFWKAEGAFRW